MQLLVGTSLKVGTVFTNAWIKASPELVALIPDATSDYNRMNWSILEPKLTTFCADNGLICSTDAAKNILVTTKAPN